MESIKSKFRTAFFGETAFIVAILLVVLIVVINYFLNLEEVNFKDLRFVLACLFTLAFPYFIYLFSDSFEEIILDEKGITIRNIVYKKTTFIGFDCITKYNIHRVISRSKSGPVNDGYLELYLELKNEQILAISQNTYDNFFEMKAFILDHLNTTSTTP
jgi:ABC-type branched-subunit amino acid transport system permease subunit